MKRLNPKTNLPFKRGQVREDGKVFYKYELNRVKSDGYFIENWLAPEVFKQIKEKAKKARFDKYPRKQANFPRGWDRRLGLRRGWIQEAKEVWKLMQRRPMTMAQLEEICWAPQVFELLKERATDYGN